MSTTETVNSPANRPLPNGDPTTWVYLNDLPTPPEVVAAVERLCRARGFWGLWGWRERDWWTQDRKLRFYYPGKHIYFKNTPRGMLLLVVAEPCAPAFQAFREGSPRSEQQGVQLMYVFGDEDPSFV